MRQGYRIQRRIRPGSRRKKPDGNKFLDRVEARGEARGVKKTRLESISSLMKNLGCSSERAMDLLKVPKGDRGEYRSLLKGKVLKHTLGSCSDI